MMARTVIFRAFWHQEKVEYHRGKQTNPDVMIFDSWPGECCLFAHQGQPVTLMQSTGLQDKTGKDIYEGDIISYGKWSDGQGQCLYKVFWSVGCARFDTLDMRHNATMSGVETFNAEVIGNIFENPELSKK